MVRFVTTSYSHMYDNEYIGRPEEPYMGREHDELTDVGQCVEKWREFSGYTVDELVRRSNSYNPLYDQRFTNKDYVAFIHGRLYLTDLQVRTISKALKITVHDLMHTKPGQVQSDEPRHDMPDVSR